MAISPITATSESLGNKALAAIPVVGPILSQIAGTIEGIFAGAHSAAVAKEASTLNNAMPAFIGQCQAIMEAAANDEITEANAISDLAQAQEAYESTVASIIQDNGTCFAGCSLTGGSDYTWPNQAAINAYNGSSGPGGQLTLKKGLATINETTHCCNSGSTCNAACCLRCGVILPTVQGLTALLMAGKGSYTIPATATNGAIKGTSAVTITYEAPSVLKKIEISIFGEFAKL
jgi:hypothetical protein